jgi:hypothetical protein
MKCRTSGLLSLIFCMAGILAGTAAWAVVPAGFVDASTYGYNTTDATAALQAAINTGQNVWVPNMGTPWVVTPVFLTQSNQTIQFESGTVVAAKAGAFLGTNDSLFTAHTVSNVQMIGYGATLQMRKEDYTQAPYPAAEWRMGVRMFKVNDFQIKGLTIKDTGGDGIYISGSGGNPDWSQDVLVKDVRLLNNHRQGISVISAKNLTIDNAVILNTDGTWPKAGIDFEPDADGEVFENIVVKNSIINSNAGNGILFYVPAGTEEEDVNPNIDIAIENVTIVGNQQNGIAMNRALPQVTIKDSLIVDNGMYGIEGAETTFDLLLGDTPRNAVTNSAFWSNDDGARTGWTTVSGSLTNVQPLFYSTDPNSPDFMYLSPSISSQVANGASDGGYMGARPVYGIPEPASLSLVGLGALATIRQRNV